MLLASPSSSSRRDTSAMTAITTTRDHGPPENDEPKRQAADRFVPGVRPRLLRRAGDPPDARDPQRPHPDGPE